MTDSYSDDNNDDNDDVQMDDTIHSAEDRSDNVDHSDGDDGSDDSGVNYLPVAHEELACEVSADLKCSILFSIFV